jgi:hypothetical protein
VTAFFVLKRSVPAGVVVGMLGILAGVWVAG